MARWYGALPPFDPLLSPLFSSLLHTSHNPSFPPQQDQTNLSATKAPELHSLRHHRPPPHDQRADRLHHLLGSLPLRRLGRSPTAPAGLGRYRYCTSSRSLLPLFSSPSLPPLPSPYLSSSLPLLNPYKNPSMPYPLRLLDPCPTPYPSPSPPLPLPSRSTAPPLPFSSFPPRDHQRLTDAHKHRP